MNGGGVMLDDYKERQDIAYSLILNAIKRNRLSHAYLFNANGNDNVMDFVFSFIKTILCDNNYTCISEKCGSCNKCNRIKNNNYPEIKIIESDSFVIKKEQLIELQSEFSRSSIEGKYLVYIIKDCEKMNKQASNSILKFLEEPVDGIIAVLVTNNLSKILETISSRCQIINLKKDDNYSSIDNYKDKEVVSLFCKDDENNEVNVTFYFYYLFFEFVDFVIKFFDDVDMQGFDIFIDMKNRWYDKIQSREEFENALSLMLILYYDVLKIKVGCTDFVFWNYKDLIDKYVKANSIDSILKKIDIFNYGVEVVRYNLNVNLLSDDIVIRLGEIDEYS